MIGSMLQSGQRRHSPPRGTTFGDVDDEFPPGDPLHRPDREVCVVPMSPAMHDMERCLERTLIICVRGIGLDLSAQDVAHALYSKHGLSLACFTVHPFFPENYLVVFDNHSNKGRILQEGMIKTDRFLLLLRRWSRLAQASSRPLRYRVKVSMEGLPNHGWSLAAVSAIVIMCSSDFTICQ